MAQGTVTSSPKGEDNTGSHDSSSDGSCLGQSRTPSFILHVHGDRAGSNYGSAPAHRLRLRWTLFSAMRLIPGRRFCFQALFAFLKSSRWSVRSLDSSDRSSFAGLPLRMGLLSHHRETRERGDPHALGM